MEECILCEVDELNPTFIRGFEYWTLLINYMQPTLGSTLVVLNRHSTELSDLKSREATDLWKVNSHLERALKLSFNPSRINHLMLANAVEHVHYHVVPRYEDKINFGGVDWIDGNYGHTPVLTTTRKEVDILEAVKKRILENL